MTSPSPARPGLVDQPTRALLGTLTEALTWRAGERPRVYGARIAELRGLLRVAAETGDPSPLQVWLDADAADAAHAAHAATATATDPRPRPRRRASYRPDRT